MARIVILGGGFGGAAAAIAARESLDSAHEVVTLGLKVLITILNMEN